MTIQARKLDAGYSAVNLVQGSQTNNYAATVSGTSNSSTRTEITEGESEF